ncbi:uncharacterized protein LOC126829773 [Patella vulgata]|uniref:uncharacterized protein LOC126829773 n=1 Tax=Patella vulgata TaxID=6465 RepID=UPI0024A90FB1|nr:uncharacterized protein LOC126829773 [Patella vulgata]XP_050415850.2 uncharacterized protein LOC126829773 [Patella vulgata]XP_050415851.2 uncharacterized protein LOC126829773 [Patella vulgata]
MPVTKLPVVHKFGIISHSQRVELQERLLKQSYVQGIKSKKLAGASSRNPLEVSDEFVHNFNNSKSLSEKDKYEGVARKMLERSKRRAGVRDSGTGRHVNLPMAWTELAQLAQCKGKLQEECLDVLITSLEVSPLERYHIPALFFLAETMLYWLRTESIHQPYLRTAEIKLLKMGQLVFTRLFYSHMAGQLQGHSEFKNRLYTYLDGLRECQEAYNPYPNALLSLRFIIEVGKIILADTPIDGGSVKEGDQLPPERNVEQLTNATKQLYEKRSDVSTHSAAISSSVHDLSPTLWHSLDVWRCTNQLSGGCGEALSSLAHCGLGLATENWIDGTIALQILGDAARTDLDAMRALHCLAQGVNISDRITSPPLSSHSQSTVTDFTFSDEGGDSEKQVSTKHSAHSSLPSLSDINERSENSYQSSQSKITGSPIPPLDLSMTEEDSPLPALKEIKAPRDIHKREVSFNAHVSHQAGKSSDGDKCNIKVEQGEKMREKSQYTDGWSGFKAECGTSFNPDRASSCSSIRTFTNIPVADTPGLHGWHWEVAVTYTDVLAKICIHGNNVNIQKMALVGLNEDMTEAYRRGHGQIPLPSAGLIDLAFFHTKMEKQDGGSKDWSWRLRYGAIQSLVKICRSLAKDVNREGIRNAAWTTLLKAHSLEKDHRVLEALKVGQVHTDMEQLVKMETSCPPSSIGCRIAGGLVSIYLPPLKPPVVIQLPKKLPVKPLAQPTEPTTTRNKLRTSLREEIMLATALYEEPVGFNTRTSFDLRRIVEDQWRKELQVKLEEEEVERQKELEEQQRNEEERQKEIAAKKLLKFAKTKQKITAESVI